MSDTPTTSTTHRFGLLPPAALILAVLLGCSGKKEGGSFSVEVSWAVPKPSEPCWIVAEVRQVSETGPPEIIASSSPVLYTTDALDGSVDDHASDAGVEGVLLDLTDVPFGDDYVVVVSLKDSTAFDATLLYTGVSSMFSLKRGENKALSVTLSSVDLSIPDQAGDYVTASTVDLYLELVIDMFADDGADTLLQISNIEAFEESGTAAAALSELSPHINGYLWNDWDLNRQVCQGDCPDGSRTVYVRLVHPAYTDDELVFRVEVVMDTAAPDLESMPSLPLYTNTNIEFDIAFTEPVQISSLIVDCGGLGAPTFEVLEGGEAGTGRAFHVVCPVGSDSVVGNRTISISASDPAGHATGDIVLGTVTVDTVMPGIDGMILFAPDIAALGDVVHIEFTLDEPVVELSVFIDDSDITSDCTRDARNPLHYDCLYTVTEALEEGDHDIGLSFSDRTGNGNGAFLGGVLHFDFTTPEIKSAKVSPSVAKAGGQVTVEMKLTEEPHAIAFDWDGLVLGDFAADPSDPKKYAGTYTVKERDVNRAYSFDVEIEDAAGNTSGIVPWGELTIDTVDPSLVGEIAIDRRLVTTGEPFSFSFTVSEPLSSLSLSVGIVGLDVDDRCVYAEDLLTYVCTHSVSAGESEGSKDIAIGMTDLAGNTDDAVFKDAVVYNAEDPRLVSSLVIPDMARGDSTIVVGVTFSEKVKNVTIDWDGLEGGYNPIPDEYNVGHIFEIPVVAGTRDGTYTIALLTAEDSAGQTVPAEELGTVTVDTKSPEVIDDQVTVDKSLLKNGDALGIQFTVSEPLESLRLFVGDREVVGSFDASCNDALACAYEHIVRDSSESEGAKSITVEMVDFAGNRVTEVFESMVVYDFTPPGIETARISPASANDGIEFVVTVTFTEAVVGNRIDADWSGLGFSDFASPGNLDEYSATYVVTPEDEQGLYPFRVLQVEDPAGNVSTDLGLGSAKILRIVFVSASAPDGGDGLAWGTALNTIQDGLFAAVKGGQIWVEQGVYRPEPLLTDTDPRQATIQLKPDIEIYGGFEGNEVELLERVLASDDDYSVLDGRLSDDLGFAYHVVTGAVNAHLDGFVIQNGAADGPVPHNVGGGVLVEKGTLNLKNCIVRDNRTSTSGAGLYSYMSAVEIADTRFYDNVSELEGGAVYNTDSVIEIKRCHFQGNTAEQDGGGIVNANSLAAVIASSTFLENQSPKGYGGGIRNLHSELRLANCVFDDNWAQYGGAISDRNFSSVEVANSTFYDNAGDQAGSGLYFEDNAADNIDIYNSILWTDASSTCQVESNRVTGDISIAFSDMPDCSAASNVRCDVGCLSEDPRFEDPTGANGEVSFRLESGSPCIDQGSCDLLPADDLDLNDNGDSREPLPFDLDDAPRCVGAADLGAYEAP